ncbi:Coatomer subunit gamma-2 [Blyttiomyces sp. JEL0837]|nr:Coatomer subunit gamma-2 [Blyttiomyces sp. JEL0837]
MNLGKKDDESDAGLFYHIDRSTVLQEARAINETPINPKKCRTIITKILYLLYQSEVFQTKEATETFFSITKLFQSQDIPLRQSVYLVIKELSTIAEDVIMVTSSLSKDMNSKSDQVKANAIRALCKITESSMLQGIERLLKQAIVDKNPSVSSAALVSSLHLFNSSREIVKRWANEVQEAINSKGTITQYHALGLMYQIRQNDRMGVIKLIQNYSKGSLRSPYAYCMLVRYVAKIMDEDESGRTMFDLLEGWLRHRNDMVVYEAARAICNLRDVTNKELFPAVSALQLMLVNHKPTLRFAAIRTLNKLAMTHPAAVVPCNLDIENLITDPNRSIATFAITTLLKTGNEASVDRLMKQITGFMAEISDAVKIIVVDAIRSLCLKFPAKQSLMINFLSSVLRDEGGYEYKRAVVEAIFDIIYHIPESKDALDDNDDEVRDRAAFFLRILASESLCKTFMSQVDTFSWAALETSLVTYLGHPEQHNAVFNIQTIPTVTRAQEEAEKLRKKAANQESSVSSAPSHAAKPDSGAARGAAAAGGDYDGQKSGGYAAAMERIPQLALLGNLFKSSKPVELTESETEYVVTVVKHVFPKHFVFQFNCRNTLNDKLLEGVTVSLQLEDQEDDPSNSLTYESTIGLDKLPYDVPGTVYVIFKREGAPKVNVSNTLKFIVKDCDPSTGEPDDEGYEDEYLMEDFDVNTADYVLHHYVSDFKKAWDELEYEQVETYSLSAVPSVKAATTQVIEMLGMSPVENTGTVKDKASTHTLLLAGTFLGGHNVLARCRMAYEAGSGVAMELAVRSTDEDVSIQIANAIV